MLEYDEMNSEGKGYDSFYDDLIFRAVIKLKMMKLDMKRLTREQLLGDEKLPEGYESGFFDRSTVEDRRFMMDLIERYPRLATKQLAKKYIAEGEFNPLTF